MSVLDTHKCNAHPSGCAVVGTLAVPQGSPADVVVNQKTRTLYVAAGKAGRATLSWPSMPRPATPRPRQGAGSRAG